MTDIFFNVLRKGLVATIALVFASVLVYIPQEFNHHHTVHEAQAFLGVDIPNLIQNTISAVASAAQHLKEFVLDGIAWAIAKAIVARLVASLVDWINSGFEGSPAFITDLGQFLLNALDEEAGRYIEELGGDASFLCDPLKLDIQIALAIEYENTREDRPPYEGCKISDMVSNVEDFADGTFKEGGWKDWIAVTQQPEKYTKYGAKLEAEKSLAVKLAKTEAKEKQQLDWGSGFKSTKICENVQTPSGGTTLKCDITTPGRTISESLSKALGAGQDTLVTADEISEIVSALIGQLANKAVTGANGLLGLTAGTGYTYSDFAGGSYTAAAATQATELEAQATQVNTGSVQTAPDQNAVILGDALNVQMAYKDLSDKEIPILQAYVANTNNSQAKRDKAATYLKEAQSVQQNTSVFITKLNTLIDSYTKLEVEYSNPRTTAARKTQIRTEEQSIMSQFSTLGVYTQAQYDASNTTWDPIYF